MSRAAVLMAAITATCLCGCAASRTPEIPDRNESRVENSYASSDADFSHYRGLLFVPLQILHADRTPMAPSDDLLNLRGEFREAFLGAMNGEYMILTRPARDVVRIKAELINATYSPAMAGVGAGLGFDELAAGGQLLFTMQIEDSYTDAVLVRASDRYALGAARNGQEKQQRIADAAAYWAGLFKEFLDRYLIDARTR